MHSPRQPVIRHQARRLQDGVTLLETIVLLAIISLLLLASVPKLSQLSNPLHQDAQQLAHCFASLQHLAISSSATIMISVDTSRSALSFRRADFDPVVDDSSLLLPIQTLCALHPGTRVTDARFASTGAPHAAFFFGHGSSTPGRMILANQAGERCKITIPLYGIPNAECE